MIRLSPLVAVTTVIAAIPATASVLTVGGGPATSCYEAAEARNVTQKALDDCNRALAEEALSMENRVATLVNRGILLLRRKDVAGANADFDAALKLDPRQAEAWLNKAIVHARFGRSADAMQHVTKAFELGTRKPALAYFVRAMAYEDSGNLRAAYQDLQRAHQLDPEWDEPVIELKRFKVRRS